MLKSQIKTVSKYIKAKYPSRYTLKLSQASNELLMTKSNVKCLIANKSLSSLGIKSIATFIIENPAKKVSQ